MDAENNSGKIFSILLKKEDFETELVHTSAQFCKKINYFKPEKILLSDTIPNTVGMIWNSYMKKMDMPKCILMTNNGFSKREQEILFDILNVVDFINPDSIIDELTFKIRKYL